MRIALIDHSYHKTTKSTEFFADLLAEIGTVRRFHDESWCGGENTWRGEFKEADYDVIVILQVHEAFSALSGRHDNVLFMPMYDAMLVGTKFYWRDEFRSAKCLSFSRKLHQEISNRGGLSRYFKYFPDPARFEKIPDLDGIRPFFWYRTRKIHTQFIFDLCRDVSIERFTLHNAPDPGHARAKVRVAPRNISNFEITTWFDTAKQFREMLLTHNVFFAPRQFEGIGQSFLEAMACGLCVVAPNSPTMNEYIANGTNGLLYDIDRRAALDFSRVTEIGKRARETIERGFADWQQSLPNLVEFIATPKSRLQTINTRSFHHAVRPIASASRPAAGKVSVVTVCLNAVESIQSTIESVLGQDRPEVEYIVLDGGSTDGTVAIIKKYAEHLTYWHSLPDEGVYHAMNRAIDHCAGDWILFMNAGDSFSAPDSLSRMFRHVPKDAEVVYGHHIYVQTDGSEEYHPAADFETTWSRLQRGDLWFDWLAGIPAHQATAIRRPLLAALRFDTTYRIAADHDLLFRARKGGSKFFNCDELISIYAAGGMSAKNYPQCKKEWARTARMHGDAAAVDRFYARLEKVETKASRRKLPSILLRELTKRFNISGIEPGRMIRSWFSGLFGSRQSSRDRSYRKWIRLYDTISDADRRKIASHIAVLPYKPLISVVMPAYDTAEKTFREAIASVRAQLYPNWELCIADDASPSPHVVAILKELSLVDPRIKWMRREVNGHISEASNSALALASGEFVALMDHDDILPEHALYEVAAELNAHPDADLIYSDEDRIDDEGKRHSPYFKTDWNPELFLGHNMVSHLGVYRRSLVEKVGGFRTGFEGSQDYDLALRVANATSAEKIRHIPAILYHWRGRSRDSSFSERHLERCVAAAREAKRQYLSARAEPADVEASPLAPSWERIRRAIPSPSPLVSLIVPTRNRHDLLGPCIEGLLQRTSYEPIEIIIIDHQSDEAETVSLLERLSADPRVRILRYEGPFNFSAMNNKAVAQAHGELIGFINNDIDVIEPDWLSEMVSLALLPEIGAVGAKLLYPNDRVQHGGVILGARGVALHAHVNAHRNDPGYFGRLALTSNVSAVTAACLVLRKTVFEEAGGFNATDLPVSFSDVDLCLKIRAKGYRNVWTPFALLYHHESPSRGVDTAPANIERARREVDHFLQTWGRELNSDPYFNVNLSLQNTSFELAFPPRRVKPWRRVEAG